MKQQFLTSNPKIGRATCLLTAVLGIESAAFANTVLDFEKTSGDPATGTMILGEPVAVTQTPLPGSTFTADGLTFDLSNGKFTWAIIPGQTVEGTDFANSGEQLAMEGSLFPVQYWTLLPARSEEFGVQALSIPTTLFGIGNWVATESPNGIPETGTTIPMLGLGLAGCIGFQRRLAKAPSKSGPPS